MTKGRAQLERERRLIEAAAAAVRAGAQLSAAFRKLSKQFEGLNAHVTALQQRVNSESGVSIDTEMSNLISLQNAYSANARVMSTIQQMMNTLLQAIS